MASAKKCDRCGTYYDKNERYIKHVHNCKTAIDGMCFSTTSDDTVDFTDLCDDCIYKLFLFLSGHELVRNKEDAP